MSIFDSLTYTRALLTALTHVSNPETEYLGITLNIIKGFPFA